MYRILLVDDEVDVAEYFERIFTERLTLPEKPDVQVLHSAKEAMAAFEKEPPDLLVADIQMPEMNGLELYRVLRARWPHAQILFLTGYMEFDYVYASAQDGNARFVTKLEPVERIAATVREMLAVAQSSRREAQALLREADPLHANAPEGFPGEEGNNHYISLLQRHIHSHLSGDLSLLSLSEFLHLNPSYLSRLFKKCTGYKLYDYILEVRMNEARHMLTNESLRIHQVAARVGYQSVPSFNRAFKKATGKSPMEYRDEE